MTDRLASAVRDALAAEREQAPLPHPWTIIAARAHAAPPQARSWRWPHLATAAVLVAGIAALVIALAMQGETPEPLDLPPTSEPDTQPLPTVAPTAPPTAVEADTATPDSSESIAIDGWVTPNPIPAGFERTVAVSDREFPGVRMQIFENSNGDTVRLTATPRSTVPAMAGDEILIDGETWVHNEAALSNDDVSPTALHNLGRAEQGRWISLSSLAPLATLKDFASSLVAIPDAEVDFEYLDANGPYTTVATIELDDGRLDYRVRGLNGLYCTELKSPDASSKAGCSLSVTARRPFSWNIGFGSEQAGSVSAGVVAGDVDLIEVDTGNGETVQVVPTESEHFPHRFWLLQWPDDTNAIVTAPDTDYRITLHHDDGSTTTLRHTPLQQWEVVEFTPSQTAMPFRPYVADPEVCMSAAAREFSWSGHPDDRLLPFALTREAWHRFQIIADPELGVDGRWAIVGTLPANYHADPDSWNVGAASEFLLHESINGWPVAITTIPGGYTDATIDLGDDTDAYIRTYRFDLDSIRALISGLAVREEPTGFDYVPVAELPGLEVVIDRGDETLDAGHATLECITSDEAYVQVVAITGDPLVQYVAILDQPYPYEIGRIGDAVVSVSGIGQEHQGPHLADITHSPPEVWSDLLAQPRPSDVSSQDG